ncbi:MAG TPA: VOC family protein [Burkholderiales bacterium]|nr:VOC family protein [Burkholderiales bacterium]
MFENTDAAANIAVSDLAAARKFYEGTLGLKKVDEEGDEVVVYKTGKSRVIVYRSQFAGTNKATNVTWSVGNDVEGVVDKLKSRGVAFEHYDLPDTRIKGDVHVGGRMKVAWFKDPDGNILCITNH